MGHSNDLETHANKVQGLDDKFWVWETLEEAVRPRIDELTQQ